MEEHAVLVTYRLSNDGLGSPSDFERMRELSLQLEAAINAAGVGLLDGNEMGLGECQLFMYGPNADALYAAIAPVLEVSQVVRGGTLTKRYGAIGDALTQETTLKL